MLCRFHRPIFWTSGKPVTYIDYSACVPVYLELVMDRHTNTSYFGTNQAASTSVTRLVMRKGEILAKLSLRYQGIVRSFLLSLCNLGISKVDPLSSLLILTTISICHDTIIYNAITVCCYQAK